MFSVTHIFPYYCICKDSGLRFQSNVKHLQRTVSDVSKFSALDFESNGRLFLITKLQSHFLPTKFTDTLHLSFSRKRIRVQMGFGNETIGNFHELIEKLGADECKIRCLNNCSCQAYAQVNNIGCLVWSSDLIDIQEFSSGGNDLYIRLAHGALDEGKPVKLIVCVTAVGFITILSAIAFGYITSMHNFTRTYLLIDIHYSITLL
ncbi:unnamed protein product [Malus baccata var. baccata]